MAQWHKKHYSTDWGVAILGFFVIVIALLIPYLQHSQIFSSNAMYAPEPDGGSVSVVTVKSYGSCSTPAGSGKCQDRNIANSCSGFYYPGYCAGAANIQCCVPGPVACKAPYQSTGKCVNRYGTNSNPCTGGSYHPGYCPGPSEVQCCVKTPASNPPPPPAETYLYGHGNGLLGKYFTWNNFTNGSDAIPMIVQADGPLDFNWPFDRTKFPYNQLSRNYSDTDFSVIWTGFILPPLTGTYNFRINSDDGAKLTIIDNFVNHVLIDKLVECLCNESGSYALKRGVPMPIEVRFKNYSHSAYIHLYWSIPSKLGEQIIPVTQLYPVHP